MTLTDWLAVVCVAAVVFGVLWLAAIGAADLSELDDEWPAAGVSSRAVGRMGLSGNLHVDNRPTDEAIAEQAAMTTAYYADPDV